MLDESERAILRGLSVFVGAFSLEAAQFVAARDILEREQAIVGLVAKSLIAVETNHAGGAVSAARYPARVRPD
jgi:predicted ATPase